MRDKLLDAEVDLKLARVQFHKSKRELWKAFKRLQAWSLNIGGTMCQPEFHVLDMGFE